MKRLLVPSLEEMDDEIIENDEPLTEEQFEEMFLRLEQSKDDLQMFFDDEADNEAREKEGEAAIENLENIAAIVKQYGISAPMMLIADPHRELVSSGVCPAYEELSDVPVISDISIAAVEGIGDVINSIKEKLKSFGKRIAKAWYESGVRASKRNDEFLFILRYIAYKMKDKKEINEDKFMNRNIRAYKKQAFQKQIGILDNVMNSINQSLVTGMHAEVEKYFKGNVFDRESASKASDAIAKKLLSINIKAVEENLGVMIDRDQSGRITYIDYTDRIAKDDYGTVAELGYKKGDVAGVVNQALALKKTVEKSFAFAQFMFKFMQNHANMSFYADAETWDDVSELESVWQQYSRAIRAVYKVMLALWRSIQHVCSSATQLGRAYIKS